MYAFGAACLNIHQERVAVLHVALAWSHSVLLQLLSCAEQTKGKAHSRSTKANWAHENATAAPAQHTQKQQDRSATPKAPRAGARKGSLCIGVSVPMDSE
uniref:Uncharacterized protein n=1 Tax=Eutreptiella gymnastica TaxID=73025 RepID=A0A7S4CFA1_9EUGL